MNSMWRSCKPERFNDFRTFYFGIKDQSIFPQGVIYEGVDETPRYYGGSSGAKDCIIPTLENLLEI